MANKHGFARKQATYLHRTATGYQFNGTYIFYYRVETKPVVSCRDGSAFAFVGPSVAEIFGESLQMIVMFAIISVFIHPDRRLRIVCF